MMIDITLNDKRLRVILNSNASKNFVAEKYAHYHDLSVRRKTIVYSLMSVNESIIGGERITDETTIMLKIDEHREKITLNIVDMINHDVILNILWLRKWNSHIDWKKRKLTFKDQTIITIFASLSHDRDETEHTKIWEMNRRKLRKNIKNNSNSLNTIWIKSIKQSINATTQKSEIIDKKNIQFSKKYEEYRQIFEKHVETTLIEHRSWDHEIRLQKEKQSTFEPIYRFSENEFKVLKKYIKINLKKRFIRSSESPADYSILFALKKNDKLKLCVNYRQLNNVTVKNRYTLPLIQKL